MTAPMTAHELARLLLEQDDLPVTCNFTHDTIDRLTEEGILLEELGDGLPVAVELHQPSSSVVIRMDEREEGLDDEPDDDEEEEPWN